MKSLGIKINGLFLLKYAWCCAVFTSFFRVKALNMNKQEAVHKKCRKTIFRDSLLFITI